MEVKHWWTRLRSRPFRELMRHKHKFVVMDTNTFTEKFSFQLSGTNLFVGVGIAAIVLVALTTLLIASPRCANSSRATPTPMPHN